MRHLPLVCFSIFLICMGAIGAFHYKKYEHDSEYPNMSFVTQFIIGIPTFLVSFYYFLATPSSDLLLLGTIIVSGVIALIIGLHYDRKKKQWEEENHKQNKD